MAGRDQKLTRPTTPPRPAFPGATPCHRPPAPPAPVTTVPRYDHRDRNEKKRGHSKDDEDHHDNETRRRRRRHHTHPEANDTAAPASGHQDVESRASKGRCKEDAAASGHRDGERRRCKEEGARKRNTEPEPEHKVATGSSSKRKEKSTSNSSSAEESEDSKETIVEEPWPPAVAPRKKTKTTVETKEDNKLAEARVAIAGRVDDLGAKAVAFSKALVRGTQALRTAARIAREAAMSFESEMENFIQAQRDINRTFNIQE